MRRHVIIYEGHRTLIDRQTLAYLAGRSVHTVRARCPVADHVDGRALYDLEEAAAILDRVPTRRRERFQRKGSGRRDTRSDVRPNAA